jgi:hypothetical protein
MQANVHKYLITLVTPLNVVLVVGKLAMGQGFSRGTGISRLEA